MNKTESQQKAIKALSEITEAFVASHPDLAGMESVTLVVNTSNHTTSDTDSEASAAIANDGNKRRYTCYSPSTPGNAYQFYDEFNCAYYGLQS